MMDARIIGRQVSAGLIVGLSAIIYSLSYGALLFPGPLAGLVGFGFTVTLITAVVGALFGLMAEEKTLIIGPDSNTISVLAGMLAVIGSVSLSRVQSPDEALAVILLTGLVCAATFYLVAHFNLSSLVRYIPFSVMAGFLAATGWLIASGALGIISGTPLTIKGMSGLMAQPLRPELGFGLLVMLTLFALARRVAVAVLIPVVLLVAAVIVNLALLTPLGGAPAFAREHWFFSGLKNLHWLPPWQMSLDMVGVKMLLDNLPTMLVVSFVGLISVLLAVASLELTYQREFKLNRVLKLHAGATAVSSLLGGFAGLLSISRTMLNRQVGGGVIAGVVSAGLCLAVLLGAGGFVGYVPKAALGGLVLFLGVGMLKQWLWDQRKTATRLEMAEILIIVILVANYGFLVGFAGGVLIACAVFIVSYSQLPLATLVTDISLFRSSVVRPSHQVDTLKQHGGRVMVYRLSGYVFFGSASKIDAVFRQKDLAGIDGVLLDFTNVSGIDSSAIGVFQRILRRYQTLPTRFYFVQSEVNRASLQAVSRDPSACRNLHYFPSLDHALEAAEESIIGRHGQERQEGDGFDFIAHAADRETFKGYCEQKQTEQGTCLAKEGEYSAEVFFVESGSLEIIKHATRGAGVRLAKLQRGAMAGELAFSTGEPRTASIMAVQPSVVYVLNKAALARMRAAHPALATEFDHMVIRKIAHALARTNQVLAALR